MILVASDVNITTQGLKEAVVRVRQSNPRLGRISCSSFIRSLNQASRSSLDATLESPRIVPAA